jgi:hypothetical protein
MQISLGTTARFVIICAGLSFERFEFEASLRFSGVRLLAFPLPALKNNWSGAQPEPYLPLGVNHG